MFSFPLLSGVLYCFFLYLRRVKKVILIGNCFITFFGLLVVWIFIDMGKTDLILLMAALEISNLIL